MTDRNSPAAVGTIDNFFLKPLVSGLAFLCLLSPLLSPLSLLSDLCGRCAASPSDATANAARLMPPPWTCQTPITGCMSFSACDFDPRASTPGLCRRPQSGMDCNNQVNSAIHLVIGALIT